MPSQVNPRNKEIIVLLRKRWHSLNHLAPEAGDKLGSEPVIKMHALAITYKTNKHLSLQKLPLTAVKQDLLQTLLHVSLYLHTSLTLASSSSPVAAIQGAF